jgi:hypothetical protein
VERLARIIFPHYWECISLAAATGEWTLACWAFGLPPTCSCIPWRSSLFLVISRTVTRLRCGCAGSPSRGRVACHRHRPDRRRRGPRRGRPWSLVVSQRTSSTHRLRGVGTAAPSGSAGGVDQDARGIGSSLRAISVATASQEPLRGHAANLPRRACARVVRERACIWIDRRRAAVARRWRCVGRSADLIVVTGDIVDTLRRLRNYPRSSIRAPRRRGDPRRHASTPAWAQQPLAEATDWTRRDAVHRIDLPGSAYVAGFGSGARRTKRRWRAACFRGAATLLLAHHRTAPVP